MKAVKTIGAAILAGMMTFGAGQQMGHAQDPASPGVVFEAIQQVSLLSLDNAHPAVALSQDGMHLFVVWDGLAGENRRIFLREQVAGEWLPPVIVDANPAGENTMPSISVDSSGVPHVAWISQVGNKRQPVYARRISRFPNKWHQQVLPFPDDSTVTGNADYVSLRLDADDQPWITWQYGFGNIYSVACTRYTDSGRMITDELTPGANSHNLYPEVFFLPEPTVYWYLAQADQFYIIGSQLDADTQQWVVSLPDNFENVPAQTFPDLFRTEAGPLGAIWYDRLTSAAESMDRVFVGIQDPESHGRGEVVQQNFTANNHSVSAAISRDQIVAAWVSENYENGPQLYMAMGSSPDEMESTPVAAAPEGIISNPRVTATPDRAAVTWEELAGPGQASTEIMVRAVDLQP